MRPIRSLLFFLTAVFLGGALLSPWLYWAAQALVPNSALAHSPFHRYVNRSLIALALAAIWPLMRSLGMKSSRDLGLVKPRGHWHKLLGGLLLGFASLACVAAIVLAAQVRQFDPSLTPGTLTTKLAGAAATAIFVAIIEELLFRGAIFGALRKVCDWRAALLLSSMIYAIVHFMQSAEVTGPVRWSSGLEVLPRMLRGFDDWGVVIPGFFNLPLAGILLGLGYQRSGNLYFSIGLHAGWIFWLKSYVLLTIPLAAAHPAFWGTQKLIDGWLALLVLACALAVLARWRFNKTAEAPE